MIQIIRQPEPAHLAKNRDKWLTKFLEKRANKPDARPSNKQYGHEKIRVVLRAMSHNKCFYCERKLEEGTEQEQVDHYNTITDAPEKAFSWDNLYLSCPECNKKLANPVDECLNPCGNVDPREHLTFDREEIKFRSALGENTVCKYKLERGTLNHLRVRALQRFGEKLHRLDKKTANLPSDKRKLVLGELLQQYCSPQQEFSLMFSAYLEKYIEID